MSQMSQMSLQVTFSVVCGSYKPNLLSYNEKQFYRYYSRGLTLHWDGNYIKGEF